MRKYYIIGSNRKRDDGRYESVFDEMLKARCVDVGYASQYDLTRLIGKSEEEIESALKRKGETNRSCRVHRLFLNLHPGDIVAVKRFAAPIGKTPRLTIHRYAVVKARGGRIYHHSRGKLSHQISVEFLDCGEEFEFRIGGYGGTIHRLSNAVHIRRIFAPVLGHLSRADAVELQRPKPAASRRAATIKNIEDQIRHVNKTFKVTAHHNKIQKRLYDWLVSEHGAENVLMESDYVDLQVRTGKTTTLYEVKPYDNALRCIREALGQIMLYAWRLNSRSELLLKLTIVGPCKMKKDEAEFLRFLKKRVGNGLNYMVAV